MLPNIGVAESLIVVAIIVLWVLPFWRIATKAGYSGLISILMILPLVNFAILYFLAYEDWPALRGQRADDAHESATWVNSRFI